MSETTLYGYWRSSAAYRVRIALNLKGIEYRHKSVHLLKNGGEQHTIEFKAINPNELVPVLNIDDLYLNQSLAIIEYLEERNPEPSLLPIGIKHRSVVRALSLDIAADLHPLNNLRVLQYLTDHLTITEETRLAWIEHWIEKGLTAVENRISQHQMKQPTDYCYGDSVTMADVCLVPQVYNAKRFGVEISQFANLDRIVNNLNRLSAFEVAKPENQPDAE
ncbi:maleylacetoacetate isomerase [Vibrio sonorensis]|uniref:maleylacetoacetate isomerase n=1 Tax=Vibrio sonorensis TaxID=1004316 RepID=UPI0008D8DAFB|nr:maleylacetoacetate isomerase [Vibrio sonorensis]